MSDDSISIELLQTFTEHAGQLNAICTPESVPKVMYEFMSGALIWSDEMGDGISVEVIWALRAVVAYRTSVMLDKPDERLRPIWELGLSLFPKWVGFRPERRQATAELLRIYRLGDVGLRKCLRDIERETDEVDNCNHP